jgi:integrase
MMELYRQGKSKYWTADFTINGRRYRKTTKQTTRARAGEVAAEFIRQAQRNEGPVHRGRAPQLREFAEQHFLPYIEASSLAKNSKQYYQWGWKMLEAKPIANYAIDRITTSVADAVELKGSGSNQNCALRTLLRLLSLAHELGVLQALPRIKLRHENERTAVWDAETEARFLAAAPETMSDVFLICQDSGMRPEEVIRMHWDDVLWDKDLIFVPRGKTRNSRRHVPLSDRVRQRLRARAEGATSAFVFPSKKSRTGHITLTAVEKPFRQVRKAAKLPDDLVLYSSRHSFATDLLDRTGNLKLVSNVLGHGSVAVTGKYVHPSLKKVAEVVNQRNEAWREGAVES